MKNLLEYTGATSEDLQEVISLFPESTVESLLEEMKEIEGEFSENIEGQMFSLLESLVEDNKNDNQWKFPGVYEAVDTLHEIYYNVFD